LPTLFSKRTFANQFQHFVGIFSYLKEAKMIEINLDQGTPEWLEWRKGTELDDGPRITATAASVCGGRSDFNTPHNLYLEMIGTGKKQGFNKAMQHGHDTEPKARAEYMKIVGEDYEPICIQSSTEPWIAASLDGVDTFRTRGVEIKCPISDKTHSLFMRGEVPPGYYDQIQWQMLASDNQITEIDYFSYCPQLGSGMPITVKSDPLRQAQLMAAAQQFRLAVLTRVPLAGSEFESASMAYVVVNRRIKAMNDQLEDAKNILKKLANGEDKNAGGAMVIYSENSGRIDNDAVIKALALKCCMTADELAVFKENFRGKSTPVTTVRESSEADAVWEAYKQTQKTMDSLSMVIPLQEDEAKPMVSPIW
jgi:putative phage-type endonuclease